MLDMEKASDPRPTVLAALVVGTLFFGGFLGWAGTAPLAGAAVAPGRVVPEGERKSVEHLDGGLIRDILVTEGSRVEAGQLLFRLDATEKAAQHRAMLTRWQSRKATEARLLAEQTGAAEIVFPPVLRVAADDPAAAALIDDERARFAARFALHGAQLSAHRHKQAQIAAEIEALHASQASGQSQRQLLLAEIDGVEQLLAKGLERRPRLLALQRSLAELEGRLQSTRATLTRAAAAAAEVEAQLAGLEHGRTEEIGRELVRVRAELAELEEHLRGTAERLARTEIRAPVAGFVVELAKHTEGGVVEAGDRLLDIVPAAAELVIEARVSPTDVDEVQEGQRAQIHLSAYKSRNLPRIDGRVRRVSADRLLDRTTGEAYFAARIEVDPATLPAGVGLAAGMPAEVFIVTGERTVLDYLLEPVDNLLRHGLRES